jgi:hypothetical protein
VGKPLADRVDIPGGDAQARDSFVSIWILPRRSRKVEPRRSSVLQLPGSFNRTMSASFDRSDSAKTKRR